MRRRLIWIGPLAIIGLILFIAIGGELVKLLWNWLLPPIFGWREISFWQGLGLLALCRILFGGIGAHPWNRSRFRRRMAERMADRMVDRMRERWEHMTPDERERFRQGMRARCGFDPFPSGSTGQ